MQDFKDIKIRMPKTVNLCARLRSDERLIEAHNQAVEETLRWMEERYATKTRIVLDGKNQEVIRTGNMVIAKHDHFESRELDPHVHSHCLVIVLELVEGVCHDDPQEHQG